MIQQDLQRDMELQELGDRITSGHEERNSPDRCGYAEAAEVEGTRHAPPGRLRYLQDMTLAVVCVQPSDPGTAGPVPVGFRAHT